MALTPIKITGMKHRGEEDSINASFDSIEKIIEAWKPKQTEQVYNTIAYYGPLTKNQTINVGRKPYEATPIFATRGVSYLYVGDLLTSGVFVSKVDTDGDPVNIFQVYPAHYRGSD